MVTKTSSPTQPSDPTLEAALQNLYSLICATHGIVKLGRLDEEVQGDAAQNMTYLLRIFVNILEDNWTVIANAFPRNCTCSKGEAV